MSLLLQVPYGLNIDSTDICALWREGLDCESPEAVSACLQSERARLFVRNHPDWPEKSWQILLASEREGIRWSCLGHEDYPSMWMGLTSKPVVFNYLGDPVWKKTPMLAIVGSRTPSSDTMLWMQRELPEFLWAHDVGVVSGGARGVDQWAHRLCLDSGKPTVCILPSGLLNPYPPAGELLWRRILNQGGCLLSTCALDEPMHKRFFHIRNRWIAGLGRGCFVVEANRRSGSLLTAKLAAEEGRDLCTLPVFPTATQGLGNLELLAAGNATLIRDAADLSTFWTLREGAAQRIAGDQQEENIHQP